MERALWLAVKGKEGQPEGPRFCGNTQRRTMCCVSWCHLGQFLQSWVGLGLGSLGLAWGAQLDFTFFVAGHAAQDPRRGDFEGELPMDMATDEAVSELLLVPSKQRVLLGSGGILQPSLLKQQPFLGVGYESKAASLRGRGMQGRMQSFRTVRAFQIFK